MIKFLLSIARMEGAFVHALAYCHYGIRNVYCVAHHGIKNASCVGDTSEKIYDTDGIKNCTEK